MRVHVRPFVRWIWLGVLMMALGSCLAVMDKRYRKRQVTLENKNAPLVPVVTQEKIIAHE
jgi:cytochrome c biogenesis factor